MAFINYAVQSAIIMGIFCVMYHLLFRRLTFFTINRFFLLCSLLLSLTIPLIKVQVKEPVIQETVSEFQDEYGVDIQDGMLHVVEAPTVISALKAEDGSNLVDLKTMLLLIYTFVSCFLFLRLLYAVLRLIAKAKNGERLDGFVWIKPFSGFNNCSFFNLLIIDKSKLSDFELQQVLSHEKEHKNRLHSLDQVFLELALVLFWFNPFIYYYKKAINAVHEYEVDQKLSGSIDKQSYGNLLLKLADPSSTYLTHGFSQSSLKHRIQFLFGKRSNRFKKVTYAIAIPLVVLIISVFSFQKAEAIGAMMRLPASIRLSPESPAKDLNSKRLQSIDESHDLASVGGVKIADIMKVKPADSSDFNINALGKEIEGKLKLQNLIDALNKEVEESLKPKSLTVVLDAGHGGTDAATSFKGIFEKDLVLSIVLKMKSVLESDGFNVVLTRDADKTVTLRERIGFSGDIFVSVHANSSPKTYEKKLSGMEIMVPNKFILKDTLLLEKSLNLASHLKSGLSSLDIRMREDFKDVSLFVLNQNSKPAVLLEVGYLNNSKDFELLNSEQYQTKLAKNFAMALKKYQDQL